MGVSAAAALALLVLAATPGVAHARADAATVAARTAWTKWAQTKDASLKTGPDSYLRLKQSFTLRSGTTGYLPLKAPRAKCEWSPTALGGPSVRLIYDKAHALIETGPDAAADASAVDLLQVKEWKSPQGFRIRAKILADSGLLHVTTIDDKNPPLVSFTRTPYFKYDPKAVIMATLERAPTAMLTNLKRTLGTPTSLWNIGDAVFTYGGQKVRMAVFTDSPQGMKLLIPFRDATSGKESYAGGRFIETELAGPTSTQVPIDLNRAFNPLCARNPVFNCVIPPGKPLEVAIRAGEKAAPLHH